MYFSEWKCLNFDWYLTEVCSQKSNWQYAGIGSDNDLAPTRWQAFIWTNDGLVYQRITRPQWVKPDQFIIGSGNGSLPIQYEAEPLLFSVTLMKIISILGKLDNIQPADTMAPVISRTSTVTILMV